MAVRYFSEFLAFSAKVTAFSEFHLMGTGMAELYLATLVEIAGEDLVGELLARYAQCLASKKSGGQDLDLLLRREVFFDAKLGPLARNVIKMWYVGTWYQLPWEWRAAFGVREKDTTFVVSAVAYTEGLLWPAIDANPSGAKGPGFGSWAGPPRIPHLP